MEQSKITFFDLSSIIPLFSAINLCKARFYSNFVFIFKRMKSKVLILFVLAFGSCTHEPLTPPIEPVSSTKEVQPSCPTCATNPICPVIDDITQDATTTFTVCSPTPSGQGSFVLNSTSCLIWTPNNQTQIVNTCIVACTKGVCDTTFIALFIPIPGEDPTGNSCNVDSVYFVNDVLPILTTNCAYAGCHNTASASDGVKLNNYANIINTGKVKPYQASNSDLYESITATKADKIMPRPPAPKLTPDQIAIIGKWINQGAKNNECVSQACNTVNVSYSTFVKPVLQACTSCHRPGNSGGGILLDTYENTKSAALSGKLYGAISWTNGYIKMPNGGSKLNDCYIQKIKSWVDAGALNN